MRYQNIISVIHRTITQTKETVTHTLLGTGDYITYHMYN